MIYGFITEPLIKDNFNTLLKKQKSQGKSIIRDGWNTFYNLNVGTNLIIQDIKVGRKENIKIVLEETNKIWQKGTQTLNGTVEKYISIRNDGVGTLTLKFIFEETDSDYYTSDILRVLMMIPRTSNYTTSNELILPERQFNIPISLYKDLPPQSKIDLKRNWKNFSYPFKLYIKTLTNDLPSQIPKWNPYFNGKGLTNQINLDSFYSEELFYKSDAQIPYAEINATIAHDVYEKLFLDNENTDIEVLKKERKKYFKEIAAILFRWLNNYNAKYISSEFWNSSIFSKDNSFKTQFINSLVFVTFSGVCTLLIKSDLNEDKLTTTEKESIQRPVEITHQSILRHLELIRLRWHYSIKINHAIDALISYIRNETKTSSFLKALNHLIGIEEKISQNIENPNYNLWDVNIGSTISEFFNKKVIENIENEIGKKLNYTRGLLNDKLKSYRTIDFIEKLENDLNDNF